METAGNIRVLEKVDSSLSKPTVGIDAQPVCRAERPAELSERQATEAPQPIRANHIRYIKLGRRVAGWEATSLDRGELHFGYGSATHELALARDAAAIKKHLIGLKRKPQAAARDAQEVLDFYTLGSDCLWITFALGYLWWAFAEPEVTWIGAPTQDRGERMRKTIGGWRNTDIRGNPLRIDDLSTKLTKVQTYQRTICSVESAEYLLRRINAFEDPLIAKGRQAKEALLNVVVEAMTALHWKDFETLIDIIFARSGWHRASAIGGVQKLTDIVLEQPITREVAAIQVKSSAAQGQFDRFIADADTVGRFDWMFFVCHSPKGSLRPPDDRKDIRLWTGRDLGRIVLRLGLGDWVMEKIT